MYTLAHAYNIVRTCAVYLVGGGLIIEANIPVQELEGQRGEGAYFREDTVIFRLILYTVICQIGHSEISTSYQALSSTLAVVGMLSLQPQARAI